MRRSIVGFHQDTKGDWVAELACLHNQHVRHKPPFQDRPWVMTESGRASHLDSKIECPLCDRAELPEGLHVTRTAGPFDSESLPPALLREHRVPEGTWGLVRVEQGAVVAELATDPPITVRLGPGDRQPLPPDVAHHLDADGPFVVAVDFMQPL